jgi:pimeloyl-[acyl-carrier protein] methyl ester esterase
VIRRLSLADGRRLAYREAGTGPPLVLIHGWAMSSAVFAEALAALSATHRVLAPDMRGHGDSEGGPGYGLEELAADLEEWFAALDLCGACLGGWSLGGQVAMRLFPAVRSRVERLLLIDTTVRFGRGDDWPHGLPGGQVRAMARDLRRNYQKAMGEFFAGQFVSGEIIPERYRQVLAFTVRAGRLPEPETALSALETLRCGDLRPALNALDCPALVLHGERDPITLPEAARYLAGRLPQGELALIPNAGHAPFLSRPEEVFDRWRKFLA